MRVAELRELIAKLGPDTLVVMSDGGRYSYNFHIRDSELTRDEGVLILYTAEIATEEDTRPSIDEMFDPLTEVSALLYEERSANALFYDLDD